MNTLSTEDAARLFGWNKHSVADAVRHHKLDLAGTRGRSRRLDEFDVIHLGTFIQIRDLMHPVVAAEAARKIGEHARKHPECDFVAVGPRGGWFAAMPSDTLAKAVGDFSSDDEDEGELLRSDDNVIEVRDPPREPIYRVTIVNLRAIRDSFRIAVEMLAA